MNTAYFGLSYIYSNIWLGTQNSRLIETIFLGTLNMCFARSSNLLLLPWWWIQPTLWWIQFTLGLSYVCSNIWLGTRKIRLIETTFLCSFAWPNNFLLIAFVMNTTYFGLRYDYSSIWPCTQKNRLIDTIFFVCTLNLCFSWSSNFLLLPW